MPDREDRPDAGEDRPDAGEDRERTAGDQPFSEWSSPPPGEGSSPEDGDRSGRGEIPELSAGLGREEAVALRESFAASERERIEATVADLLDLLGKAHAMAVLSEFAFAEGPLRFTQLEDRLGVSPNTLSARLAELTEAGLLDRRSYDEIPPRVEYSPTEKAEALFPAFAHLHHWAIEHELG